MRLSWLRSKPPRGTSLNRAHPLSKALVHCVIFNEGGGMVAVNAARPGLPARLASQGGTYTGPARISGLYGGGLYFQGNDSQVNFGRALGITTNRMTFAALIDRKGVTGAISRGLVFCRPSASGINQQFGNADLLGYHWDDNGSTYNYAGGPAIPSTGICLAAAAINPNDALLYCNGVSAINAVSNAAVTFATDDAFVVGTSDPTSAFETFDGDIHAAWVWNRTLSLRELRSLELAPFQMFATPRTRHIGKSAAAATPAPPAGSVALAGLAGFSRQVASNQILITPT